jgi:hypothetical protein
MSQPTPASNPTATCDASTLGAFDRPLGPCVLRYGHEGPVHRGPAGETWWLTAAVAEAPPAATEAPDADAEQLARWGRREQLLVLVTRVQHGRTLTDDEARTLREHVETEMREAETARQRADQVEDLLRVAHETSNRSEAERAAAVADLESTRELLRYENKRADDAIDREETAEQAAEEAQAAVERVRALASRWGVLRAYGSAATQLRRALDGTEQPTTEATRQ